jgi:hypothetical protein
MSCWFAEEVRKAHFMKTPNVVQSRQRRSWSKRARRKSGEKRFLYPSRSTFENSQSFFTVLGRRVGRISGFRSELPGAGDASTLDDLRDRQSSKPTPGVVFTPPNRAGFPNSSIESISGVDAVNFSGVRETSIKVGGGSQPSVH